MAKEIIEAIRLAEEKARQIKKDASDKASRMLAEAKKEALDIADAAVCKAKADAQDILSGAKADAAAIAGGEPEDEQTQRLKELISKGRGQAVNKLKELI